MLERIEIRLVELFPECTTEMIIDGLGDLILAKRNIVNCRLFFDVVLERNPTEQNIIHITELVS